MKLVTILSRQDKPRRLWRLAVAPHPRSDKEYTHIVLTRSHDVKKEDAAKEGGVQIRFSKVVLLGAVG